MKAAIAVTPGPVLDFFVIGHPAPQGSKSRGRHGQLYESAKGHREWRRAVADQAFLARSSSVGRTVRWPLAVAVGVTLDFRLLRPRKPRRAWPRQDVDKLARGVLDAITHAGIVIDDSYVTELHASKRYARVGEPCGCAVTVRAVTDGMLGGA